MTSYFTLAHTLGGQPDFDLFSIGVKWMNELPPQTHQPAAASAAALRQMIMGFRITQLVYVAAKLGLADVLAQGPQTPQQLAKAVSAEPRALYRLLRALASLGLFTETDEGTFALTPLARLLQTDAAGSLRGLATLYGEAWLWQAYGQLLYSIQTGQPAFGHVHHQPFYDYLAEHPAAESSFQQAMCAYSDQEAAALLGAYDFTGVTQLIDVGGGEGALLATILRAYPALSGVLFDLAPVVANAPSLFAEAGVAARCTCVAGDFFTAVPPGGDLYLLKSVIHNWDDEQSLTILKNCRRAMSKQGRLLVLERVIPAGAEPAEAKLFDINMLVVVGGQERTVAEFAALFQAAGFRLTRVISTASPLSVVEGIPDGTM
jgi:hypothetical protein